MKIERNRLYKSNLDGEVRQVLLVYGGLDQLRVSTVKKTGEHWTPGEYPVKWFEQHFTALAVRPTTHEMMMQIAHTVSDRGTCSRRRVGAVAAIDGRIITTGYNGAPEGCRHCDHDAYAGIEDDPDLAMINGRPSCVRAVHAEANVLAYGARYGVPLKGATIYTNTYPCVNCARGMISAGVSEVQYDADYFNDPHVAALARESGLKLTRFSGTYYMGG